MNYKKYVFILALITTGIVLSCSVDESKFPLPYNDKTVGAYARIYVVTSNVFDFVDQTNSAFEAIFEPVDEQDGDGTASLDFYVSHRRSGAGGGLSNEVFVKSVDVSGFTAPAAPTYSVYKRGKIRITFPEILAALAPLTAAGDPDGPGPIAGASPVSGLVAYPGNTTVTPPNTDSYTLRWIQVLKDGRRFTAINPQNAVNPAFGNPSQENGTPNITTGQFYSSPFVYTMTLRPGLPPTSWVGGPYQLRQRNNWSPSHTAALHQTHYPAYMNTKDFPDQDVTLALVTGGLPTERQFTVTYRGATTTMKINLDPAPPGASSNAMLRVAAPNTPTGTIVCLDGTAPPCCVSPTGPCVPTPSTTAAGFGMLTATTANTGTVFVPLQNTGQSCTSTRQFYWVTPATGSFIGTYLVNQRFPASAANSLPIYETPNRGMFIVAQTGTVAGEVMTIGIDDDVDEYGRRYGYCTWYRRTTLVLTRQ